jgi:hypothetical protein
MGHQMGGKVAHSGNIGHHTGSSGDNDNVEQPHLTHSNSDYFDKTGKSYSGY